MVSCELGISHNTHFPVCNGGGVIELIYCCKICSCVSTIDAF